jgi:hypothetical protein
MLTVLLSFMLTSSAAFAADDAQPTPKRAKTSEMSPAKRRELERRIEALEQKYEMQYRETDSGSGAPGAAPAAAPAEKPAAK